MNSDLIYENISAHHSRMQVNINQSVIQDDLCSNKTDLYCSLADLYCNTVTVLKKQTKPKQWVTSLSNSFEGSVPR